MCRKTGSDCRKWVPLFSPLPRLASSKHCPQGWPGAQQPLVETRPTPGLEPVGCWSPWPGQAALNLIFLVWEAAGPPRTRCGKVCRERGPLICSLQSPACLVGPTHRGPDWTLPSHSPPLPPGGGVAGPYLVLPLHKLCPGVQALDGVHSVLCGHLPPVPALQHAVPLLPPAAGDKNGQGPVSRVAGRGRVVRLRVPTSRVPLLQGPPRPPGATVNTPAPLSSLASSAPP